MTALRADHWLPFVLPFLVYMAIGSFEPRPPATTTEASASGQSGGAWISVPYRYYPQFYALRLTATIATGACCAVAYRTFPIRVSGLAIFVGIVGAAIWIGLCRLHWESALFSSNLFQSLGLGKFFGSGTRAAFDPFTELAETKFGLAAFLAIRFLGLVCVVPLIEEFFLRGFLLRFVSAADWWKIPVGQLTRGAIVAMVVYGVLTHPAELLAAAVWFSLITWLVSRTRNIWDGVAAHATTNLLLGIYVVAMRDWSLW